MDAISSYVGLTALLSFLLSMWAAALAVNLYALLRTGRTGASWRVLIIATVMFALLQAVRLAELFGLANADEMHLSSIVELAFVVTLLYAFYLQRRVFTSECRPPEDDDTDEVGESTDAEKAVSPYERYS